MLTALLPRRDVLRALTRVGEGVRFARYGAAAVSESGTDANLLDGVGCGVAAGLFLLIGVNMSRGSLPDVVGLKAARDSEGNIDRRHFNNPQESTVTREERRRKTKNNVL